ncbi:transposase [Candidatus Uhrbacteria bacterium]|nr:transposase [Candidatus Uhrbacteria bacterium]
MQNPVVGTGRDLSASSNSRKSKQRKGNRLPGHNYSTEGWYYVTTCAYDRAPWFGVCIDGFMNRSQAGHIVENQWRWLSRYPYVRLDQFVVMPNHFHGILVIDPARQELTESLTCLERTGRDLSLHAKVKSLSELVGAFKMTSSKRIHELGNRDFAWQRSFHDHIIRDESDLARIREYIRSNPENWETDELKDM